MQLAIIAACSAALAAMLESVPVITGVPCIAACNLIEVVSDALTVAAEAAEQASDDDVAVKMAEAPATPATTADNVILVDKTALVDAVQETVHEKNVG